MNSINFPILSNFQQPALLVIGLFILVILAYLSVLSRKNSRKSDAEFKKLYSKISEDIKYSIAPHFIKLSSDVSDLVELAVEIWRIEQRLTKFGLALTENQRKSLDSSIQKLKRYVVKYDLEIIDYTNQRFNDGLNLDILSVEKDSSVHEPTIKETVEPTIMLKGQVVRKAKIILIRN
ncbi:MAG: hypothetical protein ABIP54_01790 [Candidatus Andersenbacteria bacterium]